MLLRDHPLMFHRGFRSWPPAWVSIEGAENNHPRGELGVLREVVLSKINPADRCFLYIDHERSMYVGCLLIDDHGFCDQIVKLLQGHYNSPIMDIGSLDLSHTFNNVVSTINVTEEEEPPKPPPDEDEPKPPIKEPPTEKPPVKEPPPKND